MGTVMGNARAAALHERDRDYDLDRHPVRTPAIQGTYFTLTRDAARIKFESTRGRTATVLGMIGVSAFLVRLARRS